MTSIERLNEQMAARRKAMEEGLDRARRVSNDRVAQMTLAAAEKFSGEEAVPRATQTHIRARIGGKDMLFQMTPEDVPAFEQINGSAYGFYLRIKEGKWTVADLLGVMNFAAMTDANRATLIKAARFGIASPSMARLNGHVERVLASRPVGPYASLAMLILASAIFGIEDAEAYFSDEE